MCNFYWICAYQWATKICLHAEDASFKYLWAVHDYILGISDTVSKMDFLLDYY